MSRGLLVAVAFMLLFGATAAARTGEQAGQPKTLASVRGRVDAVAQNGPRIAWIKTDASCARQVQILTLPGRRPVDVGGRTCIGSRTGPLPAIALSADGRVLWQRVGDEANTYLTIQLFTASLRDRGVRVVKGAAFQTTGSSDPDYFYPEPLPMTAEGKTILFYARCEIGPICSGDPRPAIYKLGGHRSSRLANVTSPVGLAVSGRRFAIATNSLRCCNFTPAWSHDGTRLAWIYHGNLWTVGADGTGDRQLAGAVSPPLLEPHAARRPSWSPDDAQLVFERTERFEGGLRSLGVYRVDATGRGLRRLASGTAPAWSPDGTRIAFVRGTGVFAINPDGTGEARLTAAARATAGPLSWSPDSTRIAVSRGGDIYSIRIDGAGETRLTASAEAEAQPAWSPDGARISYVDGSIIGVVNADGTGATHLTSPRDPAYGSPAWSPDSRKIAFARGFTGTQKSVWVMNADGSGQRRLIPAGDSPQWAPGGSTIAVGDEYADPGGYPTDPGIRLVSPVDGKARRIAPVLRSPVELRDASTGRLSTRFTIEGRARAMALGPDYVALLVDHDPGFRIELFNLNGRLRTAAPAPSSVRSVSAAGRTVVFATGRVIRRLDAGTGAITALATARGTPVGLTIAGRRVVWAEHERGGARIRAVTAP